MAGLYARRYAQHFASKRRQAAALRTPEVQAKSDDYDRRWAAAITATEGNVRAAVELMREHDVPASEQERTS